MRSLATSVLIRVPAGSDLMPVSMLQLHLMGSVRSPQFPRTAEDEDDDVLDEIARSYYDLYILSWERWKLRANRILPFHLGALEVMQEALDRGEPTPE